MPTDDPPAHSAWLAGLRAWPGVALPFEAWGALLLARGVDGGQLTDEQAADWYILGAVLAGSPGAAEALARRHEPALREALRRASAAPQDTDDTLQKLWTDLLLDQGQGPRLASWEGRGQLAAFLRVSAVRLALKARRSQQKFVSEDELFERQSPQLSPELSYLKETYREAFRTAFQGALDSLPSRDQLLLRQSTLDGLSIDELAGLYRVHRATAARWVAAARETLVTRTRRRFFETVALPPDEGDSVMNLVQSRLDETIRRRLQRAGLLFLATSPGLAALPG
jgi:RNA polymerase sigma-70 factor (ECF subfamily)